MITTGVLYKSLVVLYYTRLDLYPTGKPTDFPTKRKKKEGGVVLGGLTHVLDKKTYIGKEMYVVVVLL